MSGNNADSRPVAWVAIATLLVLLVPAVAMQFTDEVNWGLLDFLSMGALVFAAGVAFVFVARRTTRASYRIVAGIAIAAGVLLVWASLAVGF
jgi:hypothetical protein